MEKLQSKTAATKDPTKTTLKSLFDLKRFLVSNIPFILLLVLISAAAFSYSLSGDFVTADDVPGYVENPQVRDLPGSLKSGVIQKIVFALNYALFKNNPIPLHIYSLTIHLLNVIFVFVISYMMFGKKISAISTLLFSIHPTVVESVAWISGMNYLHQTVFLNSMMLMYLLYKNSRNVKYLYLSILFFILPIFVLQPTLIMTFPLIIIVMDQVVLKRNIDLRSLKEYILFILSGTAFFFYYLKSATEGRVSSLQSEYGLDPTQVTPWLNRLPYTFYKTILLLIFPKNLSIFHEGEAISLGLYYGMVVLSSLLLLTIIILYPKHRIISGLLIMVIVSILPTISPVQLTSFMAERYLYIGTAFFCMILALIIQGIQKRSGGPKVATAIVVVILTLYFIRTVDRTVDWHSSKNLWLATSGVAKNSARVYNNLGDAYASEKEFENSINAFKKAIELKPGYTDAMHNLALTYLQTGQYDPAKEYFNMALETDPNYIGAPKANEILTLMQQKNL